MLFVQVTEAQVEELKGLIAAEESVDYLKQIKIIAHLILGQPEFAHFIVGFEAAQQLMESLRSDHVGVQVKLSESHTLL